VDDILDELNYLDGLRPRAIPVEGESSVLEQLMPQLSESERKVAAVFGGGAVLGIDALAESTGLGASDVAAALMMLELKKLVTKRADGAFEARSAG
jgi:DNA processing protein